MTTHGRTEFRSLSTHGEKYFNATKVRLPCINKSSISGSSPDVQAKIDNTIKLQHFIRQRTNDSFTPQLKNRIADSENFKTKLLDLEDQKADDFQWWNGTPAERLSHQEECPGHSAAPDHESSSTSPMNCECNRSKRTTWSDVEALLRREDCALLEYDLRDASGGTSYTTHNPLPTPRELLPPPTPPPSSPPHPARRRYCLHATATRWAAP